ILGPAPAASNNRNQGKCLGTKPGALHVVEVFANIHADDIVVGHARPPSELNEYGTYFIAGGRTYFTLASTLL
ncbi:hypothetical protein QPX50_11285, partial [Corynebacterium accolens]|uniref:hypothetical protein n=1 Tax=Corynebacterium accolens TaxID=38284 RepID=UPI002543138E